MGNKQFDWQLKRRIKNFELLIVGPSRANALKFPIFGLALLLEFLA